MNWMIAVSAGLTLSACFIVACRIDKMLKGITRPVIFYQHALLALGFFVSFVLGFTRYADLAEAASAAGVVAFFLLSANRWKNKAPEDTNSEFAGLTNAQMGDQFSAR